MGRSRRLRLLCLHGYHGSAQILRGQLQQFASVLESCAEFVCIDAPSLATNDFGWWHAVDRDSDPASDDPGVTARHRHYKGWERTRDRIVASFEKLGPFDGVLGFSQGAALAGLLVGLRAPRSGRTDDRPLRFDFALLISGFSSNDPELARLYERRDAYELPSLHMIGRADTIVPRSTSHELAHRFASSMIVEHDGGHVIPSSPAAIAATREFLESAVSS